MNAWKFLCAVETLAIAAALLWPWPDALPASSGAAAAEPATSEASDSPQAAISTPPSAIREMAPDNAAPTAAKRPTVEPRPPVAGDGLVSLIGIITDEAGAPISSPSVALVGASDERQWLAVGRNENHFLLADSVPGSYDLEIKAEGYATMRGPVVLRTEPRVQRQEFRLQRSWRVLVYVRTTHGEDLVTELTQRSGRPRFEFRCGALALRDAPTQDLASMASLERSNAFGGFHQARPGQTPLPEGCVGTLDLEAEPPLVVAVWLNQLLLGAAPIEAGADEVVLVVDEAALLERMGSVALRVVDAEGGAPLTAARASLTPPWMGASGTTVNADGRIRFDYVAPGVWDLDLSCQGYAETYRSVLVRAGERLDLGDVALSPTGELRARIVDTNGSPIGDVGFTAIPTGGWQRPEFPPRVHSRTDENGILRTVAGRERYQIILGGGAYGLQAVVWERGAAEIEEKLIQLQPGVSVTLLTEQVEGLPRLLWLLDDAGNLLVSGWRSHANSTSFSLTPGSYLLRVEDLDRNLLSILDLHVPAGGGELKLALP